ncbi:histone deacetylase [Streptomyces sioyaensis]|uniref:histone deacetylase n=1 Tax=Streptomyces sioyaensis TaxID=67364 RepID=UPI001F3B1820|nr:histone deacetylase [Streptomyces sioyaensis]MCF3173329.1 histone deacetylase [Streptomyces sioyaensis]
MIRPRRLEALDDSPEAVRRRTPVRRLWYAAYGSNMHRERLTAYLAGGRPPGGLRTCPGCRDPRDPTRTVPLMLPGLLYFATESQVWTGGRAFYDPGPARAAGAGRPELPCRAYLLTTGQFSDIVAQEMYREPGEDLDLTQVLTHGRARIGPGRYETLVCAGTLDGYPVLTCTAPWSSDDVALNAPSAAYLRHIGAGIVAAHDWSVHGTARYLAGCPGAAGHWTAGEIAALLSGVP